MASLVPLKPRPIRCAIYTRKSVDAGLEQEFNSLESQRDMCSAYIRSQRHREWLELPAYYDDGGFSGGTLVRPAVQRLFADIENGLVDMVVVYKLDRLTRSLSDFIRLIDLFDRFGTSFVSVTQAFDTRDTMGRLILNILLTFAQFEREMTADRMRDRIMTLAKNGRWTGGRIPLGYDRVDRRLVVNPAEAEIIRFVFERFVEVRSCRIVAEELQRKGCLTKTWVNDQGVRFGGTPIVSTSVYNFLGNRLYVGEITHKGEAYPGIHEAIVSRELWEAAQTVRSGLGKVRQANPAKKTLLAGLLFDGFGRRMISHSPARHGRIYRYYISAQTREGARQLHRTLRVDAAVLEAMVRTGICVFLRDRFELGGALLKRGQHDADLEALVDSGMAAARHLEALEPARLRLIYEVLIRRVEITRDKVRVILGCEEILLLLAWDGIGILRLPAGAVKADPHIHAVEFEAESVRTERAFTMPVEPRAPGLAYSPNPRLVALLKMARKVQAAIQAERHLSIAEIAVRFEKQPGYVARVLRLNYLAPDIQTAILDGLQPPELNSRRLLFGHIPMEWREQRTMLGFPPRDEVLRGLGNYRRPYRSERVEDAGADQGE